MYLFTYLPIYSHNFFTILSSHIKLLSHHQIIIIIITIFNCMDFSVLLIDFIFYNFLFPSSFFFFFFTEAAVRSELVEQVPHVAMICQEAPDRFRHVLPQHLLGIVIKYLRDNDNQVIKINLHIYDYCFLSIAMSGIYVICISMRTKDWKRCELKCSINKCLAVNRVTYIHN